MVPSDGVLICRRCGKRLEMKKGDNLVSRTEQKERRMTVIEDSEAAGLPTTKYKCPECGNDTAYWWLRQLRSADESEVRFFRCTKCNFTWREYD
jgi:DNA-directed RNA polymerase subunit M